MSETTTSTLTVVDTEDGRLATHGLVLRGSALTTGRQGWLWVLELPERVDKAVFDERSVVWSAATPEVPAAAVGLLAAVTGGRALHPAEPGTAPGPQADARDGLDDRSPVAQVVEAAVADSRRRMIDQDLGLRLATHPEFVHQARVATRTLRSDLRTFRPLLDRVWVERLRGELKVLGTALGEVRDLDVLGERFDEQAATLDDGGGPAAAGAAALRARLRRAHGAAHDGMAALLASPRYLELLAALEEAVRWGAGVRPDEPAAEVAPRLVRKPWRRLARTVAALPEVPSDHQLHEVRLRAKQVRYAANAVVPVIGDPALRLAERAKALQQVLGDHQDAAAATLWLRGAVDDGAGVQEAWFAGQAALLDARDRRAAREGWPSAWDAIDRRSLRRWLTQRPAA